MALQRLRARDDGTTLMESLVAVVLFASVAAIAAGVGIATVRLVKSNDHRVVAGNLATERIEAVRGLRALDIPDGSVVTSTAVGNTTYQVSQTANYVPAGSTASVCAGSATTALAYKLVTVTVTWPDMGTVEPVRTDTLRALGLGSAGLAPTTGTAAVAVLGAGGSPRSGVAVTLTPSGTVRTTGADGCAVFAGLTPSGTYGVTLNQPGWVDPQGAQAVTRGSISVTAGQVTRHSVSYDRAGALRAALAPLPGYAVPARLPLTLSNQLFTTPQLPFPDCTTVSTAPRGCVSGTPRTASALFPGTYGAWAGTCADAKPSGTPSLATVAAEAAADVTVPLAHVQATAQNQAGTPLPGGVVYAVHARDTVPGCPSGESWPVTADASGVARMALPAGTWTLALTPDGSRTTAGTWPTVTLTAGAPAPTAATVRG